MRLTEAARLRQMFGINGGCGVRKDKRNLMIKELRSLDIT